MPPRKQRTQSTEVHVYKDDGVWWAEIDDMAHDSIRSTFNTGPEGFLAKVDSMLWYVELDLDDVTWAPRDDAAKKFLNRARKLHANGAESDEDTDTTEDEDADDDPAGQ